MIISSLNVLVVPERSRLLVQGEVPILKRLHALAQEQGGAYSHLQDIFYRPVLVRLTHDSCIHGTGPKLYYLYISSDWAGIHVYMR